MARLLAGDAAQLALAGGGTSSGNLEEPDHSSSNWYFSREEIEKRSPSRMDGIDLKKETYFRKSYCTFVQDLGMCLKVPQVTIATAIVFCHRFYLRQSHMKNDRHMIATICMFLAGKVEETPRPLRDVILMSYEIRYKKDPVAVAKIKQKDVYEEQKELVLVGERLVLITLGFDLNIHHPYKPLVAAIKKFKVAQNALAQVAWNFVNDGLRTSLCLQFKPHHIAAGAIFLAAKFLKVKLPADGEKVWWQEFDVTPRQLEEVSNQMLELYEQNKTNGALSSRSGDPGPRSVDPGPSTTTANRSKTLDAVPSSNGHYWPGAEKIEKHEQTVKTEDAVSSMREELYEVSSSHAPPAAHVKLENGQLETEYEPVHGNGAVSEMQEVTAESRMTIKSDSNGKVKQVIKQETKEQSAACFVLEDGQINEEVREKKLASDVVVKSESGSTIRKTRVKIEAVEERKVTTIVGPLAKEVIEGKSLQERTVDGGVDGKADLDTKIKPAKVKSEPLAIDDEEPKKAWVTSIEDVNTDRVKALAQKRRKSRGEGLDLKPAAAKVEVTDEEELLERELESGVEAAAEAERVKQERRDIKPKLAPKVERDITEFKKEVAEDGEYGSKRRRYSEESGANEKKRMKTERTDADSERSRMADRSDETDLASGSHIHDQPRSPRHLDRRPVPSGSHEKMGSPSKRHREPYGRRDSHRDVRVSHGSRDRDYHQRDHHHQHRTDGDRDRHHHKERDYQERDHKKARPHEQHGS